MSRQAVQRAQKRAERIAPDVMEKIKRTPHDVGVYLDKLAGMNEMQTAISPKYWPLQT
jgi:hypothetical protein